MLREKIANTFEEVMREHAEKDPPTLTDQLVLLESGLDSLGFAILVTRLEDSLGYDPFSASEEAYYPRTFGDFVSFYEKHAVGNQSN